VDCFVQQPFAASDGEKEYYGHATARYAVLISSKRRAVMRKQRSLSRSPATSHDERQFGRGLLLIARVMRSRTV
jgi:hypothetical protein